ncbi:class I SAM-dependent methyltransferase [Vicingaceae bacterium]|nr:class I SAM-dependent methyltransferase [bacterium]MDC1451498.1 class I SAM-dependent methyltransferase [Vicingaceae bacterium]
MNYYKTKQSDYHSGTRMDVISFLKNGTQEKALEIGAGGGDSLCFIKENNLAEEIVGVELFELQNSNQTNPLIDKFIHGNIEHESLDLEAEYFDVIILADILEHLIDPWKTVEYVSGFLKKGGKIITSLPNIQDFKTMIKIYVKGDFRYREDGVLDKTHLRFFCKKNMIQLLTTKKLEVKSATPAFKIRKDRNGRKLTNLLTLGLIEPYLSIQYIFEVKRIDV